MTTDDLPLGAHKSIAGGIPRAVEWGALDRKNLATLRQLSR
jgi:hypothetical protein